MTISAFGDVGGAASLDLGCTGGVLSWALICCCCNGTIGVGGSGLFTSELFLDRGVGTGAGSVAMKLSNETTCGCLGVTSLPCRCLGAGGGFFLPFFTSDTRPMLSSSSDSGISYDVRGVSWCVSCADSYSDWRDIDEVSVLLPLSNCGALSVLGATLVCGDWADGRGVGLPVKRRFLKLSTSNVALLLLVVCFSVPVRPSSALAVSCVCGSNDASVREKGFAGTPVGDSVLCRLPTWAAGAGDMLIAAILLPSHVLWDFKPPCGEEALVEEPMAAIEGSEPVYES